MKVKMIFFLLVIFSQNINFLFTLNDEQLISNNYAFTIKNKMIDVMKIYQNKIDLYGTNENLLNYCLSMKKILSELIKNIVELVLMKDNEKINNIINKIKSNYNYKYERDIHGSHCAVM